MRSSGTSPAIFLEGRSVVTAQSEIAFRDVRVFDGESEHLSEASDVVVSGNVIRSVTAASAVADGDVAGVVIDGGGRALMPGLIDVHAHLAFSTIPLSAALSVSPEYIAI